MILLCNCHHHLKLGIFACVAGYWHLDILFCKVFIKIFCLVFNCVVYFTFEKKVRIS